VIILNVVKASLFLFACMKHLSEKLKDETTKIFLNSRGGMDEEMK